MSNSAALLDLRFELREPIDALSIHDAHDESTASFTHRFEVPVDLFFGGRTSVPLVFNVNMIVSHHLERNVVYACAKIIGEGLRRVGRE